MLMERTQRPRYSLAGNGFICAVLLAAHLTTAAANDVDSQVQKQLDAHAPRQVDFQKELASQIARDIAEWVVNSNDNRGMPFVIIDKLDAKVFVFKANGQLRGAAPALLGIAHGDDSVAGVGEQKLSNIPTNERTTPAGRFVASLDHNLHGEEILWVDYATGISMHRVHTTNLKEQRGQRLSSPTTLDNRITFGCINVPVDFYKTVVSPAFTGTNGIVYVLPEIHSLHEVFMSYGSEHLTEISPSR